ncbi:MAG TPA: membrane dipeptidase, partial [Nordella sp.]|nr:membrane dipeptidase [Nordella sp.]
TDAGLSRYGISLIAAMNRAAMIVDGSHTGYRTSLEAIEICERPFIFSHSNAFALVPHYRNIKDDQIKACAATGGIIGVNGVNEFLGETKATTEAMFRHVDYIANLVGPEHVGIGLDYVKDYEAIWRWMQDSPDLWPDNDGAAPLYPDHAQPEQILDLAAMLLEAGYSHSNVRGILGENYLRVLRQHQRPDSAP